MAAGSKTKLDRPNSGRTEIRTVSRNVFGVGSQILTENLQTPPGPH